METEETQPGLPAFVRDPLGAMRRRWLWMVVAGAVGLVATTVYVFTIPVVYLAQTTVLVASQQIPERFVEATVTEDALDRINALVGELLSRGRLIAIIEKHDPYPHFEDQSAAVGVMKANVNIAPQIGVGRRRGTADSVIFNISFRHSDPKIAADVANDLASLFVAASSRLRGQQARITTEFMRTELSRAEGELREADREIADFKGKYRGELPSELEANLAKLERLAGEREALQASVREAEGRISLTLSAVDTTSVNSPYARLQALQAKLAAETAVHTEEHPNVLTTRRQIQALEAEIGRGGGRGGQNPSRNMAVAAERSIIAESKLRLDRIAEEIVDLDTRVARTPERQEELTAMEERTSVLRESYIASLRKVQAAELAESLEVAQQGERVQVIDRALPPHQPERLRMKYFGAGVMGSLLLALGLAAVLELFDPVIVSRSQIEQDFGLPVLGGVPEIG